jgi:hypothetical protein
VDRAGLSLALAAVSPRLDSRESGALAQGTTAAIVGMAVLYFAVCYFSPPD